MTEETLVVLGLGCNVGDRHNTLTAAILLLNSFLADIVCSSRYESAALLLPGSPPEWNMPFLNMAVKGTTTLSPIQLLASVKAIEQQLGRQKRSRWSPREIDVDILAYGDACINIPDLHIPHTALHQRSFALMPFAEIYPDWRYPASGVHEGKTAQALALALQEKAGDIVKLDDATNGEN